MGKKQKVVKAVSKALKSGNKISGSEMADLQHRFGHDLAAQQVAKGLAANKGTRITSGASTISGVSRDGKQVVFRPVEPGVHNIAAAIMNLGGGQSNGPRLDTDSPGKGWYNTGTFSRGGYGGRHDIPKYVYGGSLKNAPSPSGGKKNGKKNGDPDRSSGEYDAIIAALQMDAELGRQQQEAFANMMIESNYNTTNVTSALAGTIAANAQENTRAIREAARQTREQATQIQADQALQIAEANAVAAEQSRQAAALGRAYVPNLQETAVAPILGDYRAGQDKRSNTLGFNSTQSNTLSGLAILGSPSASLSGLRIA